MDFTAPNITLQARPTALDHSDSAIKKVFANDPGLVLQLLLVIPIIAAGILLGINALQWVLVSFVTLLFLVAGVFRTAALLQINQDRSITEFHASRIRSMGNALVTVTAGLSLITYLFVFVPQVVQML
ncbi:MAG: diacylglycerol kinase [Bacteroidota bacterium]